MTPEQWLRTSGYEITYSAAGLKAGPFASAVAYGFRPVDCHAAVYHVPDNVRRSEAEAWLRHAWPLLDIQVSGQNIITVGDSRAMGMPGPAYQRTGQGRPGPEATL